MTVRIGFPSSRVAYRQLVPYEVVKDLRDRDRRNGEQPTGDFAIQSLVGADAEFPS